MQKFSIPPLPPIPEYNPLKEIDTCMTEYHSIAKKLDAISDKLHDGFVEILHMLHKINRKEDLLMTKVSEMAGVLNDAADKLATVKTDVDALKQAVLNNNDGTVPAEVQAALDRVTGGVDGVLSDLSDAGTPGSTSAGSTDTGGSAAGGGGTQPA